MGDCKFCSFVVEILHFCFSALLYRVFSHSEIGFKLGAEVMQCIVVVAPAPTLAVISLRKDNLFFRLII